MTCFSTEMVLSHGVSERVTLPAALLSERSRLSFRISKDLSIRQLLPLLMSLYFQIPSA